MLVPDFSRCFAFDIPFESHSLNRTDFLAILIRELCNRDCSKKLFIDVIWDSKFSSPQYSTLL